MKTPVTRLDDCQYLLISQINYTLANFADHSEKFSHDAINRYLRGERITPRLVWENVREQVVATPQGYVVFDDTVLDKNASFAIELVRRQYSGNAKAVIKGIGVVTCVYVNPALDQRAGPQRLDRDRDLVSEIFWLKILEREGAEDDPKKETQSLLDLQGEGCSGSREG